MVKFKIYLFFKRFFDVILSFFGMIILSPLYIIISLLVLCTSRGGIFFRGERVGKDGTVFKILKFRSMKPDSEGKGKWNVGDNDPRITKIGHFLRKTKLDELPQLFLVFIGTMSFVGPRPELKYYTDMYTDDEKVILEMRPGLTDWATMTNMKQFIGFTQAKDPDEFYLNFIRPLKINLQIYYYYHRCFRDDCQILILTVLKVITRSNKLPKKVQVVVDDYYKGLKNE